MRGLITLRGVVPALTQRRLASTLGNNAPKSEIGRVIVSGIQPTGVPHVRRRI